jgi:uncharacterized protein YecE (DUF72 family)
LLAQFPPSFVSNEHGNHMLKAVIHTFSEYKLAVELRHKSWSDDPRTAEYLHQHNTAWVSIDEPKFDFSVAAETPQTADFSYFRFHGRNAEMWWKGNNETCYMYLYNEHEVAELAEKVKKATANSQKTLVYFNNHWKAYAPRNASDLRKALQLPLFNLPIQPELGQE